MDKVPMTQKGYNTLEAELKNLKGVERPAVIEAISEARAHGDLKENAEYHAAKERQSFIEGRIIELEGVISAANIIDIATLSGDTVKFGATVKLADEDSGDEVTYQIVGPYESDADNGKISTTAPIAKGLMGKSVGDSVEIRAPKGSKFYEVLEVRYIA